MKIFNKGLILPPPIKLLHSLKIFNKGLILPPPLNFYIQWRSSIRVYFSTPVKLLHSLKIFNKGLILPPPLNFYIHWRSSITVWWWWWCVRDSHRSLSCCVPIYNMKLAMMQKKTPIFTTFSAHTKMAADKRGQIEVFARNGTCSFSVISVVYCNCVV